MTIKVIYEDTMGGRRDSSIKINDCRIYKKEDLNSLTLEEFKEFKKMIEVGNLYITMKFVRMFKEYENELL